MSQGFPESLTVDGRTLAVRVSRKRVKNLNARLRGETLLVSAPVRASRAWVEECLPDMARRLLRRDRGRDLNRDGLALAVARRVAERFESPPAVEAVEFEAGRTSVWGTYNRRTGVVRLSAALRHMPAKVLEGVVAHELCHSRWRTHGPRFRALLRRVDPDAEYVRGFLDGAQWIVRNLPRLPPTDLGPLASQGTVPGSRGPERSEGTVPGSRSEQGETGGSPLRGQPPSHPPARPRQLPLFGG